MDIIKDIKKVLQNRTLQTVEDLQSQYRHGAVLIPLFQYDGEYRILFTKRTNKVEEHKGQISFPGGSVDDEDWSYQETALREAYEEVGIFKEDVTILGQTDDTLTLASNFIIHPFVGCIPYPYDFQLNTFEVKRLIEVPVEVFISEDSTNPNGRVEYNGDIWNGLTYEYQGDVIWGATAKIMGNLMEIIGQKLVLPRSM